MPTDAKKTIEEGRAILGIELGSTRIKAVLTDADCRPIAQGSHQWENRLEEGLWTYSTDDIWNGMQHCYADLVADIHSRYGLTVELRKVAAIGVSAMMHGYIAIDMEGELLVPFRTWRNTNTVEAAAELSELFNFNIPLRWSISHLYQAILNGEEHIGRISFLTTLAGYVHWKLTGRRVLGIGDASGMLPIDSATGQYSEAMTRMFDEVASRHGFDSPITSLLPEIMKAGQQAGKLTAQGAALLDVSGVLQPGIPFCPPEGDAGTGMVATNAVLPRTGNVSAGTSSFSMIVLEKELSRPYEEIDIVTTPTGEPVAMVHCNNCTSDLNSWIGLFKEYSLLTGQSIEPDRLYSLLYNHAMEGEADCGGLVAYNFVSGEPVVGLSDGCPMFLRGAADTFNLANFFRAQLYASLAVLKIGNDILFRQEDVRVDRLTAHGGLFRTKGVGQRILAAALNSPISVMDTAGEGGAWGIAILAAFMADNEENMTLGDYLEQKVFKSDRGVEIMPQPEDVKGFETFLRSYCRELPAQKMAVKIKYEK